MNAVDNLAKDLYTVMTQSDAKKPKPYDTTATVVRVDSDDPDKVWVHIPGGVEETEVRKTVDAKVGDNVQVRVSGGRAWLTGNSTAPPTDNAVAYAAGKKANKASEDAVIAQLSAILAQNSARQAQASAEDARRGADRAWDYADDANLAAIDAHNYAGQAYSQATAAATSANEAKEQASNAMSSATTANVAANSALLNLSTVENVLELLQWSREHGYFRYCASETTVTEGKVYFVLTPTLIPVPTGSPSDNGYYEITGYISGTNIPILIRTTDSTIDPTKDYYSVSGVTVAEPTGSPKDNGYYELIMDESLSDYVSGHLAMDDRGLWLLPYGTPESMVYKVLISAVQGYEGITIFGADGIPLARYGSESIIGKEDEYHIRITSSGSNARLSFYNGDNEIAYISEQQLYITKTVVLDEMQLNTKWKWAYDPNDESIYLKWITESVV